MITEQNMDADVTALIARTLDLDAACLRPALTVEQLGLDSLDVVKVTFAIERHYSINLSNYSFQDIKSLQGLTEMVKKEIRRGRPSA